MNIIVHKRGDAIVWPCSFTDENDAAIDLTGMSIKMQAKANPQSDTNLFDLSIGNGITVTNLVGGLYEVKVLSTTGYAIGEYQVDIEYTDSLGVIQSTETFKLKIEIDITR